MDGLELHFHWLMNSLFLETNLLANFRSKELLKVSLTELSFCFSFSRIRVLQNGEQTQRVLLDI